ncbi:unnamed protein product [Periconia digitata]|uniref:Uncharacterized protein n=1 Tax=Periconia digitata TaxID=1303443 RepID=A0A9W4U6P4_9PLEO|nr:unnamed protein product [Periconia digitata]
MAQSTPSFTPAWRQTVTLAQAFAYKTEDIKKFVDDVADHAGDIWAATGNVGDAINLARAAQDLSAALWKPEVKKDGEGKPIPPPEPKGPPLTTVLYPTDLQDDRLLFDWNGIKIRSTTIYDTLAYVLSVTGYLPQEPQNPVRDYYLPLAAVYANWCYKLGVELKDSTGTFNYHISWFDSKIAARPGRKVLLGSTIGKNQQFRDDIKNARAAVLKGLGYTVPPPAQDKSQNFGGCCETSFFIYAKQADPIENSASGFALYLDDFTNPERETYNVAKWAAQIRNPCAQSCQKLFGQIGWKGNSTFKADVHKKSALS